MDAVCGFTKEVMLTSDHAAVTMYSLPFSKVSERDVEASKCFTGQLQCFPNCLNDDSIADFFWLFLNTGWTLCTR
ncbi:hypothetical protein HPB48_021282 [Haemaphysalis longicornis]|uniref:Uncharacterized protein n=1 Tax=Haemaphysalis longicornis TaxID=44386 RepID=A0A9J6FPX9_HAELO|nr:hypothetical protein HPB48_021282 [Haemaphysalis longicornis]